MAETDRGYPIFTGSMAPAGPVQMQQLAEAIDADVGDVAYDSGYISSSITFMNGFVLGTAINGFRPFAYRIVGKTLYINGLIRRPTAWAGGVHALTLPAFAWPARQTQSAEGYIDESGRLWLYGAGLADGQVNLTFIFGVS